MNFLNRLCLKHYNINLTEFFKFLNWPELIGKLLGNLFLKLLFGALCIPYVVFTWSTFFNNPITLHWVHGAMLGLFLTPPTSFDAMVITYLIMWIK